MGYFVQVQINRLVCRETESVVSADVIAMAGAVVVDGKANGFVLPLRRMRSGSAEDFHEVVFDGHSDSAEIGFALVAWDIDRNGKWVDNREDIETVKTAIETGIKLISSNPLIAAVPEVIVRAVDAFVALDDDDRLTDHYGPLPFLDPGYAPRTQEYEIRFRRKDPTGYSDWDYSLFFTVTYYQAASQFGTPEEKGVWQPAMGTLPAAWLGAWGGGDGDRTAVSAVVSEGAGAGRLKVRIEEKIESSSSVFTTEGVLVSRVMVEAGGRHLDTDNPFLEEVFDSGPTFAALAPHPLVRGLSEIKLTIETGDSPAGKGPVAELDHAPILLRTQLGGDLLRLDRQAVLELHHETGPGGKVANSELRYRRPVDDLLYPERPTPLDAVLERRVRDPGF